MRALSLLLALTSAVACTPSAGMDAGRPRIIPGRDAGPIDGGSDAGFGFTFDPSNVGNRVHSRTFPSGACSGRLRFDTDDGTANCASSFEYIAQAGVPAPADRAAVFYVPSIDAEALQVTGSRPAIIVAGGSIRLSGDVWIETGYEVPTPLDALSDGEGEGGGGAPSIAGTAYPGSGGGGFCSPGGQGSTGPSIGGAARGGEAGIAYGNPELIPLRMGSTGGVPHRFDGAPGRAGGALQLVARDEILIERTARVWLGQLDSSRLAGGSSGGALLLEAPTVVLNGQIQNGGTDADPDYSGGAGSIDGLAGHDGDIGEFGGGGGGSGYVRVNTASGAVETAIDSLLIPPPGSPCFTEGTLAPPTEPTPPPTCDAVSGGAGDCEVCLGETCCDQLTLCRTEELCQLCLDSPPTERGPGCAGDPAFLDLRACAADLCPSRCGSF